MFEMNDRREICYNQFFVVQDPVLDTDHEVVDLDGLFIQSNIVVCMNKNRGYVLLFNSNCVGTVTL